ncbi:MAG: transposase [Candidatus Caldatribacterium sp.]|nr:transposase [Candidatus Caldatribacterium sp.]
MAKSSTRGTESLSRFSGSSLHLESLFGYASLAKLAKIHGLSKKAKIRLEVLDFARKHPVAVTCRRYGIARSTYYRWKKKFNPRNLKSLIPSRRPKKVHKPRWTREPVERIQELKETYPFLGKEKLTLFLKREGFEVSSSTVGRILWYLRRRGVLKEARVQKVQVKKSARTKRPYAKRKPKDYIPKEPGDLIAIDTLEIRPLPGVVYKQFSGSCVVSRFAFASLYTRATAGLAREFLEELLQKSPFPVRGIQVDGGSEFYGEFEEACREYGIELFVLPPRSPKLNGVVERLNRTFREEFWAYYDDAVDLKTMRDHLKRWTEEVYNRRRPHWSLGYRTPWEYLRDTGIVECPT